MTWDFDKQVSTIIIIVAIGFFGIFWTLNIANANIHISMDDNTKEAIQSLNESIGQIQIQESYKFNETQCLWNTDSQEYWCFT